MVLPVYLYGHPVLRQEAEDIDKDYPDRDIQKSLELYKEQLRYGYIRTAYLTSTKYVAELKAKFPTQYKTGNISFGYLD